MRSDLTEIVLFRHKFGLVRVDFSDPDRKRTPKLSTKYWKLITSAKRLPNNQEMANLIDSDGK